MRLSTTLLVGALLGACSGDSAPVFTDSTNAIDRADSALSAGDSELAKAGYEYARDNGEGDIQADALIGLFELGCANSDDDMAYNNFEALSSGHVAKLTQSELKRMVDLCVTSANVETGDSIIDYAMGKFPEMKDDLTNPAAAIEKIRTEGPGADLSGLGYAGD
ncbi:MAG: hypothetical protein QGF46_01550 [Planctomycetota bacterium]|nr:hypothetical protein [Planctomycetota bacterium]